MGQSHKERSNDVVFWSCERLDLIRNVRLHFSWLIIQAHKCILGFHESHEFTIGQKKRKLAALSFGLRNPDGLLTDAEVQETYFVTVGEFKKLKAASDEHEEKVILHPSVYLNAINFKF